MNTVITYFWVTSNFFFLFFKKKKLNCTVLFWTALCSFFSPANAERAKRIFEIFPAILPFSLSTPLVEKSRMTHTHTYTTIPCNSHATMPCTWTRYGEPLPRLPINTGERTEPEGGTIFWEREEHQGGQNFGGGKVLKREKRRTFENREERNRTEKKIEREGELRERSERTETGRGRFIWDTEERKRKQTWGGKNRDCGLCTEEKKDRSSPPGHHRCASSPLPQQHRHPATINAARRETGQNREGRRKNRDRGLCTEEEKKRQPHHRLESSSFLLPAAAPTTFHYRQTINGEEQNKRGGGAEIAEGSKKKKKKTVTAALPPGITPDCHRKPLSAQLPEHFHFR